MQKIIAPLALYLAIGAGLAMTLKDATAHCPQPPRTTVAWALFWPLALVQIFATDDQCTSFATLKK